MTVFDFAQVARIALHDIGYDLREYLADLEERALADNVLVIQVWLKLSSPWNGSAVDIPRSRGYFFGGVLPRWFDEDGLLMEKLLCDPDFEGIQLHTEEAKELLSMIKEDWAASKSL